MDWASCFSRVQQHPTLATGLQHLSAISPAQWCQIFYLLAAGCVLIVASTPAEARTLLINYGARKASPSTTTSPQTGSTQTGTQQPQPLGPGRSEREEQRQNEDGEGRTISTATAQKRGREEQKQQQQQQESNILVSLIALVTSYGQVPHSWFLAFYVVSVGCSLFWAGQYLLLSTSKHGDDGGLSLVLGTIALKQASSMSLASGSATSSRAVVTHVQLVVAWGIMFLQGTRRVYEHLVIMRPSKSTMWFVHWVLGLGFYVVTNVAVWVEGAETILTPPPPTQKTTISAILIKEILEAQVMTKLATGISIFLYAYTRQYMTHAHLASLKKYSLPSSDPKESGTRLFKYLVCPHYTCECLLYLAMAITASPEGQFINKTLLCGLVFVVVNLGVTARGTRAWYVDKFGEEAVRGKWNMIPFVF